MNVEARIRRAIHGAAAHAIATTDTPWALNRSKAQLRAVDAVLAEIWPHITEAVDAAHAAGMQDGRREEITHTEFRGQQIRTMALLEAAVMLKRHGHRTAVDRVQALATPTAAPDTTDRPAAVPRPPHDPQNGTSGPTRNTPQEALEGPSEPRTPTGTAPSPPAGPSAAPTGPQPEAFDPRAAGPSVAVPVYINGQEDPIVLFRRPGRA